MIRMSQKPLILRAAGVMNITLDALMLVSIIIHVEFVRKNL